MHQQVAARVDFKNINDEITSVRDRTLEFYKTVNEECVLNTEYLKDHLEGVYIILSHLS